MQNIVTVRTQKCELHLVLNFINNKNFNNVKKSDRNKTAEHGLVCLSIVIGKVKFSHTRYRALGPELIPVYRQSARR